MGIKVNITLTDEKTSECIEMKTSIEQLVENTEKIGMSSIHILINRGIEELQKNNKELKFIEKI